MTDDNGDDWTMLHHDDDVTKTIFKELQSPWSITATKWKVKLNYNVQVAIGWQMITAMTEQCFTMMTTWPKLYLKVDKTAHLMQQSKS